MRKLIAFLPLIIFLSCDSARVYEVNRDFPDRTWKAYQEIEYTFDISDTTKTYDLFFNIRNTSKYPNYNIYFSYELMDSIGNKLETNLENLTLFDPKTGFPFGKSSAGDLYEHQFPIIINFPFPYPGKYSLLFEQKMRYENLPEIYSTGARVAIHTQGAGEIDL